jgi:hypothetical protein
MNQGQRLPLEQGLIPALKIYLKRLSIFVIVAVIAFSVLSLLFGVSDVTGFPVHYVNYTIFGMIVVVVSRPLIFIAIRYALYIYLSFRFRGLVRSSRIMSKLLRRN